MSDKPTSNTLTHMDADGRVQMVDVGAKASTDRRAMARGSVMMDEATLNLVMGGQLKKGDALELARVAGIMAAKKTSDLIPLCHPLNLSHVNVEVLPQKGSGRIDITAEAACSGQTGVEMEALTAVSVAALTLYDMVKAVDRGVVITDIMLVSKSGGRSGTWVRPGL